MIISVARTLKAILQDILDVPGYFINLSISPEDFPNVFKHAVVKVLIKKGDKLNPSNESLDLEINKK